MIPITIPFLGEEEVRAAGEAIRSGWLTQGTRVAEFERSVAAYCATTQAVAVANCTVALHLALLCLDIGPGDEVICPSISFIATPNAIQHVGATPVFADVDARTYNLDPHAAEAAITPRTKAILVVHQIGMSADMDRFNALAASRGIKVLEDAACAIGSRYKGRPIGGHSEMACFSFNSGQVVSTGEGGIVTTNSAAYAERLRLLRQHGMSIPDTIGRAGPQLVEEEYVCVGYNCCLTDIQAAIGTEQMKKLDSMIERRRRLAAHYTRALTDHPWLQPPHVADYAVPNFQSYAVHLSRKSPVKRHEVMQRLLDQGIATRRGIRAAHQERAYGVIPPGNLLARSEEASASSFLLPLYPQMTEEEQNLVISALCGPSVFHPD